MYLVLTFYFYVLLVETGYLPMYPTLKYMLQFLALAKTVLSTNIPIAANGNSIAEQYS